MAQKDETARRLMSIPGFGPITASAMAATNHDTSSFSGPREFAAFLGLTPKQNSSGGKPKLGHISKMGNRYLRKLLVVGAHALLFHRTRAIGPIAMLPTTPALRREELKLQVGLITPTMHVKGYAAPETKAAVDRANLLIKQAEVLGEPVGDHLLLFSVLYGFWIANYLASERRSSAGACSAISDAKRKSKERPVRSWLGIVSWLRPCCARETLREAAHTLINYGILRPCCAPSTAFALWPGHRDSGLPL